MNKQHCIVIGGGIAGLSATRVLAENGWRVTLLEEREYLGGRVRSFTDRETGEIIDNGQHLLMGCYTHTLALLDALGTRKFLTAQKALAVQFIDANGDRHTLDASLLPGKAGVGLGILRLSGLNFWDKTDALRLALRLQISTPKTDGKTALEFLRDMKQSPRIITRFWEPIILATLNASPDIASANLLVEVLKRAFFGGSEASKLLLPSVGLSELLAPFPEWLHTRGGTIRTSAGVEKLVVEHGKIRGIVDSNGVFLSADAVISAVPPRALERILPDEERGRLAVLSQFSSSPIISLYLWFDRDCMDYSFSAMLGTATQWIFNKRKIAVGNQDSVKKFPGHISLTISAGTDLVNRSAEEIATHCLEEIRSALPEFRSATMLAFKVIKEKNATFRATPEIEKVRPSTETAIENFYLAGDWTKTGLPATIEGAAQSGVTSALALLAR